MLADRPGDAAHALHLLGEIAAHPNRSIPTSGVAYYQRALALAEPAECGRSSRIATSGSGGFIGA